MKFEIGDRVVVITKREIDNKGNLYGKTGTVADFSPDRYVGVYFDEYIDGHCLHKDVCKQGHGWYVDVTDIDILTESNIDINQLMNLIL